MDMVFTDYAGMNAIEIAFWIGLATAAGWSARLIVRGKRLLGLGGDMAIGLIGVYLMAVILYLLGVDLTERLLTWVPSLGGFAVWLDIAISALLGALIIRAALRPFTGSG